MSTITKFSPVTGELLGEFPISTADDVKEAVARARMAFSGWRATPLGGRLEALGRMKTAILNKGEEFARRISQDTGKPLVDSLMTELMSIPLFLEHYASLAPKVLKRQRVKTPLIFPGKKSYIEYFPMGVIGIISPWNFPFQLSMVPLISALIGGNTVVLKPSEVTPITGEVIRELLEGIELPRGVAQVVQGDGTTGAALVEADIDKIFFTGSLATGRKVMAAAAQKPIPVELELGGKDAMIVCADANLKRAVRGAVWGGLLNCGQVCTSVERIFVVQPIYDRFVELLREEMTRVKVGAPEEDADMGPITFPAQLAIVERHVKEAMDKGANLILGGKAMDRPGQFYHPTLLTDVRPHMTVFTEETFGPVLPVIRVRDEEEAIHLANEHIYGLTGSVWTANVERGLELASRMECGQVMVNDVLASVANPALPFGGVKSSGFGRYHGKEGLLAFMNQKAIMAGKDKADHEPFWFPYRGKYPHMLEAFKLIISGKLVRVLGPLKKLSRLNEEGRR